MWVPVGGTSFEQEAVPQSIAYGARFCANNGPLVIYSNPLFVGNAIAGLQYAPPPDDPRADIGDGYLDSYTGVGEVVSVQDQSRLFASHHANFTLKRSLLATWDEAKLKGLIFTGA